MTKARRWKVLEDAGYTATDIAEEMGKHKGSVARVLNGETFSLPIAEKLAEVCGTTVIEMFPKAPRRVLRTAA